MHGVLHLQGSYPGTLFRFPLRSTTTAASSNIKPQPTNPQQALQLLQSLTEVLPQALLFLKSLQEIEVYVVGDEDAGAAGAGPVEGGSQDAAARLLFKANLKPLDGGWFGVYCLSGYLLLILLCWPGLYQGGDLHKVWWGSFHTVMCLTGLRECSKCLFNHCSGRCLLSCSWCLTVAARKVVHKCLLMSFSSALLAWNTPPHRQGLPTEPHHPLRVIGGWWQRRPAVGRLLSPP